MKAILTVLNERPKLFADTPSLLDIGLGGTITLPRIRLFWVRGDVPKERLDYLSAACEIAFKSAGYQAFNEKQYMHLARSYYDQKDAEELIQSTLDAYKKAYKKLGLIK
jgi:tripartite-type tricarboxylate transporter receptor subunit TctC